MWSTPPDNRARMIDLLNRAWESCYKDEYRFMPHDTVYRNLLPHIADYLLVGVSEPELEVEDLREYINDLDAIATVLWRAMHWLMDEIPAATARVATLDGH
jgi:hypothetical protein